MNHAVEHLRAHGHPVLDTDLEHLSPLHHERINLHGRYNVHPPDTTFSDQPRPLTTPRDRSRETCTTATETPTRRAPGRR